MPLEVYIWTDPTEDHLAEHGVTPEEFEEVVEDRDEEEVSRSSGRFLVRGYTSGGRFLCCVYERDRGVILPWTAYELHDDD